MTELTASAGRRLIVRCLVAIACLSRPALADSGVAMQHYERALEQLKAGALEDARASFEEAYRQSPHHLVLYNLGRVSFELGDHTAARGYLERYLEQGGDTIPVEDRERARDMLARTDARTAALTREARSAEQVDAAASSPHAARSRDRLVPPEQSGTAHGSGARPGLLPALSVSAAAEVSRERRKTLALTLGAAGTVMAAVGAGILIWNEHRRSDYEASWAALRSPPPAEVHSQEELEQVIAYVRAREQNEADFAAARQLDVVGWTIAGVGAALAATGVVLYVTRSRAGAVTVGAKRTEVFVGLRY